MDGCRWWWLGYGEWEVVNGKLEVWKVGYVDDMWMMLVGREEGGRREGVEGVEGGFIDTLLDMDVVW